MTPGITTAKGIIKVFAGSGVSGFNYKGGGHPLLKKILSGSTLPNDPEFVAVLKTITEKSLPGNSNFPGLIQKIFGPLDVIRFKPLTGYLANNLGLKNPGIEKWIELYGPEIMRSERNLIFSIAGNTIKDIRILAEKLKPYPHLAIELNTSCPNIKHGNNLSPEFISEACYEIKNIQTDIDLILKLAYDPNEGYLEIAGVSRDRVGTIPIGINSVPCKHIPDDPKYFGNFGGVSGKMAQVFNWKVADDLTNEDFPVIIPSITNLSDLKKVTNRFQGREYAIGMASAFLTNPFQAHLVLNQILKEG